MLEGEVIPPTAGSDSSPTPSFKNGTDALKVSVLRRVDLKCPLDLVHLTLQTG